MFQNTLLSLIHKALINEISSDEQALLKAWLESSMENQNVYDEIKKAWEASSSYKPELDFDNNEAFEKFLKTISRDVQFDKTDSSRASAPVMRLKPGRILIAVAAALVCLLTIFFVWKSFISNPELNYQTTEGQIAELTLPDGSQVWLDENSNLSHRKRFGSSERQVNFTGKGYFEIVSNPQKTFRIQMTNSEIEVLGTSFHVDQNADEGVTVYVDEGKVAFIHSEDQQKVELEKGSKASYLKAQNKFEITELKSPNHAAWKNKGLSFVSTNLDIVLEDIEAFYQIDFVFDSSVVTDEVWNSPNLGQPPIEDLLKQLSQSFPHLSFSEIDSLSYEIKLK